MFSIGLSMILRPGKYDNYKKAHDNLWQGLAEGMRAQNISMSIYRFKDSLFLHAVAPTEADWLKSREDPTLAEWSEFMSSFLETDAKGDIKFEELPEAFAFGLFSADDYV